jgi:hypothetical protein
MREFVDQLLFVTELGEQLRAILPEIFTAEAEALAGPKGRHQRERTHHHWGRTATELTFGGRRIQVARPRVRSCEGQEAVLPAVARWRCVPGAGSADGAGARADPAGRVHPRLCGQPGGGAAGDAEPGDEQERVEPDA